VVEAVIMVGVDPSPDISKQADRSPELSGPLELQLLNFGFCAHVLVAVKHESASTANVTILIRFIDDYYWLLLFRLVDCRSSGESAEITPFANTAGERRKPLIVLSRQYPIRVGLAVRTHFYQHFL